MIIEDLVESLIDHRSSGRTSDSSQKILLQYTAKYKDRKAQVSQYVETGEVNSSLERKVKFRIPENDNRPSSRGSFRVKEPNQNNFVVAKGLYLIAEYYCWHSLSLLESELRASIRKSSSFLYLNCDTKTSLKFISCFTKYNR